MVSYSWVSVCALFGFLFLFLAFASAQKTRVIYSFMFLQLILIFWTGGSFMMRIQMWPSVNFWHYVSIAGLMLLPYSFYRFFLDFLEVRSKGTVIWLIIFGGMYLFNLFTEAIIPTPQIIETASGRVQFLYTYSWPIWIMIAATVVILLQIMRLFLRFSKGDALVFRQLCPVMIGIVVVAAGNVLSTVRLFAGIPVDIISGLVFAGFLVYALNKKRMFKLMMLVAPSNCYAVAVLISILLFYSTMIPLKEWLQQKLQMDEKVSILLVVMLMVASIYLLYLLMKQFLENLFIKEEQIQAATIKEFSYAVSRTLKKEQILADLTEVIQKMLAVECVYVSINNGNGCYVMEQTSSPLVQKGFVMKQDHPLVQYLNSHEGCILMEDYKRTSSYLSMWETEKKQLADWGVECIAPMKDSNEMVGIVMLSGKEKRKNFSYDDLSILLSVNSVCSMAVKNSKMYEQAYDEARKDELTGLFNRKRFYEAIQEQFDARSDRAIALLLLSVDDFKLYNQLYGAHEADLALQKIAAIIRATTADRGMAFRMVGKEFAVLLPAYDIYSAKILAEAISEQVRKMNDCSDEIYSMKVLTLSCGVCASPYLASSVDELIANTDLALYSAKRSGKNTVVMYSEDVGREQETKLENNERISSYDAYASTIYALTAAIDTKDHYTFSHSQNVAYYASELAREYGLNQECIDTIKESGLLHDIGKIGIPEDILNKPGRLTLEEYDVMKSHVENSIGIIRHLPSLDYVIPAVISHHERYDGKGYPRGIAGEDIPLMGRMLCVVDSFDAMISRRSYKDPMPVEKAVKVLREEKGKQFDPKLAELFAEMVENHRVELNIKEPSVSEGL